MSFLYLDNNATTSLDPRVREAMLPYMTEKYGNASSGHIAGREAKAGLTLAREQVAALLGCSVEEIAFTGGASEANNYCIKGAAFAARKFNGVENIHLVRSELNMLLS
jgi:cysteine desulfurase